MSQRWYEVIDYMNGPLYSFNSTINAINRDVWDSIPWDLQQILIEEGAKQELEALRLAAIQNVTGCSATLMPDWSWWNFRLSKASIASMSL